MEGWFWKQQRHITLYSKFCFSPPVKQTYYIYYGAGQEPLVHLGVRGFISCMFAVGLSIGVVAALGGLLFMQVSQS